MIKKIALSDLRLGMYVHDLDCGWMDHPFVVNKFSVSTQEQISKIKNAGISELFIDTSKGLDVQSETQAAGVDQVCPDAQDVTASVPAATLPAEVGPEGEGKTSLKDELQRAVRVKEEATEVITSIMEDVRLGKQVEIDNIGPVVEGMVDSVVGNPDALLGLTRIREMDKYTFEHSVSVSILLSAFAKHMGMPREEIIEVGIGGILHDIGKTKTPLNVLNKPAKLTENEFKVMRQHVTHSEEILSLVPSLSEIALNIALEHHERFDGSGYPLKKKGDEISIHGQMAAIVDVYDAITADRCYHRGILPNVAMKKLIQWSGNHFNPELVQLFIHCVGIYPIGSLVSLSDGRFAVVIESSPDTLLRPVIRIMFDSVKRSFLTPEDINLEGEESSKIEIVGAVEPEKWRIDPIEYLDVPAA